MRLKGKRWAWSASGTSINDHSWQVQYIDQKPKRDETLKALGKDVGLGWHP